MLSVLDSCRRPLQKSSLRAGREEERSSGCDQVAGIRASDPEAGRRDQSICLMVRKTLPTGSGASNQNRTPQALSSGHAIGALCKDRVPDFRNKVG